MLTSNVIIVVLALGLAAETAWACKCGPGRLPCQSTAELIFVGTVTETANPYGDFIKLLSKLTPQQLARIEGDEEPSLDDMRDILITILPEDVHSELRDASSQETLEDVVSRLFPYPGDEEVPTWFQVEETFRGGEKTELEVWSGLGFGDCGYVFTPGKRYLVYAWSDDTAGRMETGLCANTRELGTDGDDEELMDLRAVKRGDAEIRVFGFVGVDQTDLLRSLWHGRLPSQPMAGVRIELRSDEATTQAVTDGQGQFIFSNVPAGEHHLTAIHDGYRFRPPGTAPTTELPVRVDVPKWGCVQVYLLAEPVPGPQ